MPCADLSSGAVVIAFKSSKSFGGQQNDRSVIANGLELLDQAQSTKNWEAAHVRPFSSHLSLGASQMIFVEISEITHWGLSTPGSQVSDKLRFLLEKRCSRPCQLQWFAIGELNCAVNGTRRNTAQSHYSLFLRQAKISHWTFFGAKESFRMSCLDNQCEFHQPVHKVHGIWWHDLERRYEDCGLHRLSNVPTWNRSYLAWRGSLVDPGYLSIGRYDFHIDW